MNKRGTLKMNWLTIGIVLFALIGVLLLALPTILNKMGLHPEYSGPSVELPGKRALVITTSHSILAAPGETKGKATGVFGSEMTHPYYTFLDGGMDVSGQLLFHGQNTRGRALS
jgi:hypothetical protein